MTNKEWPDENRIDLIGLNGNEGNHYMKIKLLAENAKAPVRATEHAAGYDIHCNEHITLMPGARALVKHRVRNGNTARHGGADLAKVRSGRQAWH